MGLKISEIKRTNQIQTGTKGDYTTLDTFINFLNKDISIFKKRLKKTAKGDFFGELFMLLSSGIDLKTALEIYSGEQSKKQIKEIATFIKDSVIQGVTLSEALKKTEKFTNYDINSIRIGEETGYLNEILEELAVYYKREVKQRKQLLNALNYPIIVLLAAFGTVLFLMNYLVPMLANVFKRVNKDLPPITKLVINISDFFSDYWLLFFLIIFTSGLLFYLNRKKPVIRKYTSIIVLKVPVLGNLVQKIYLTRFAQSMSLLISSRIPIINALHLIREMIDFYPIETALKDIEIDILKGKSLHQSLQKFPIFERKLISLIKMAEEVNKLDLIFKRTSEQYADEVERRITSLNTLIEPVLIIFVGVIVSVILIAMYLPMFQIGNTIF